VASPPYQALLVRVLPEDYEPPAPCFVDWAEHPEWFTSDVSGDLAHARPGGAG
jgi:hypothetical protein